MSSQPPSSRIEILCEEIGLKMTEQRRIIARVLSDSHDHPDVDLVYQRAVRLDSRISLATVYRTVRLFDQANLLDKHDFGDGRARYEQAMDEHHDHLIDVKTGKVIEFANADIERLQRRIAHELGYRLVDHRLELFAIALEETAPPKKNKAGGKGRT